MPKSYRDAVVIARELDIQYLWIDFLCIVQDDAQDWEQEAAIMASIYEGAQVTIATAWGSNGESVCFHGYQPTLVVEAQLRDNLRKGSTIRLYMRPFPDSQRYLGGASLSSRAWTLQEIILSRRTTIFAEDQLYWHCTSLYDSEDGLELSNDMAESALSIPSLGPIVRQPVPMPSYELYDSWQSAMQNFSARSMTYPKDNFAALAGVTRMFQGVVNDEPILGLWKKDICRGLLWNVPPGMHGKLDSEAIEALNIPTWSWAKICGLVDMRPASAEACVEMLSVSVSWSGVPLTSRITGSSIRGRGKLIRISGVEKHKDDTCLCQVKRLYFEKPLDEPPTYHRAYWFLDECTPEIKDTLSCLLICIDEAKDRKVVDPLAVQMSVLIVAAIQISDSQNTYRRIGLAAFPFPRNIYHSSREVDFTLI